MNIALIGYGKMGKEIEKILREKKHKIALVLNEKPKPEQLKDIDVAIEFSQPKSAVDNLQILIENKIPTICGTTGWLENEEKIHQLTKENKTAFLYASNFSLGVNIFFELNKYLAKLIAPYSEYDIQLKETHHTQKKDAPSGTAVSLAEQIIENSAYQSWHLQDQNESQSIPIESIRKEQVPGTHRVVYESGVDQIQIQHIAKSRKGFALGAVLAAEWIQNKKGIFSMKDVLGFNP